jgi:hypothetical protein
VKSQTTGEEVCFSEPAHLREAELAEEKGPLAGSWTQQEEARFSGQARQTLGGGKAMISAKSLPPGMVS